MKVLRWLEKLFTPEPHYCPMCGREMIRGYSNPKAIVFDMCPCPHPIMHIPTISDGSLRGLEAATKVGGQGVDVGPQP